jgi:predicted DNA-binding protein with PD1-like motif
MKYSQADIGRTFILRLEDGDILHEIIENFAIDQKIDHAVLTVIGGADQDSRLVVGPEKGRVTPVNPMEHVLSNVHEVAGTGTLFPDEQGRPVLHMHIACGRNANTVTGCVRQGVKVWHIMEVVIIELTNCHAMRKMDTQTGFALLDPG